MAKRHTISIDDEAYKKLKRKGVFGESYTQLILRLLSQNDTKNLESINYE